MSAKRSRPIPRRFTAVVPKLVRAVTEMVANANMSYYPQHFAVIAPDTEQYRGFGSALPPTSRILHTGGSLPPTLGTTDLQQT